MNKIHTQQSICSIYFIFAGFSLLACLFFGVMAAHMYILPEFWKDDLGFIKLRPFHVSSAIFWILSAAIAGIYGALQELYPNKQIKSLAYTQFVLFSGSLIGIYICYALGIFGGREYWEFPSFISIPIAISFILFLIQYFINIKTIKNKPVYEWMWMSGIIFLLFTFSENYLWTLDWFRQNLIRDMTVQWKSNGSFVGSWNQLIYGTSFYLMEKISGDKKLAKSNLAFGMYFLGLFNLMFNWGHHVYTLPGIQHVRYIGYAVSMTEWVFLLKIIYNWKNSLTDIQKNYHYFPYKFLMAADIWVLLNIILALMMSIPSINVYTHGTQITVAHAMGTTIGINTMILLAASFSYIPQKFLKHEWWLNLAFGITQFGLIIFWISLIVSGIIRSKWQMSPHNQSFSSMMESSQVWFLSFNYSGSMIMISLSYLVIVMMKSHIKELTNSGSSN
jgi:nitric oxide reductase subunit B